LKIAPSPLLSATTCAVVPRLMFQARTLPSSVENRKSAGPEPTTKFDEVFETAPVGLFGTLTTSARLVPSAP
jgi:hypothetical protein